MSSLLDQVEFHTWHRRGLRSGVLAVHAPTGVAVVVSSERTPAANQRLAGERLLLLMATLPWSST